jgi:carbon storage regulator
MTDFASTHCCAETGASTCFSGSAKGVGHMREFTQEVGETFAIDEGITIKILGISGNEVRLGIEAPQQVKIHRTEVLRRIASRLQQKASRTPGK